MNSKLTVYGQNSIIKRNCANYFFSVPQVLQAVSTYMEASNDQGTLRDVKDGTLFQATCGTKSFVLFYDELECGNALGSHKGCQKLGVIYASLRCFEPYMYAELESILPYIIIPSKGLKSLDRVLKKVTQYISLGEDL